MGSQSQQLRNGTRIFFGEDEPDERKPEHYFCKEIRDFKNHSRYFHEFYAQAEGVHNPRSFDRDQKNTLETVVIDACHYPNRYEGKKEFTKDEEAESSAIVDEILAVSKMMSGNAGKVELEVVFLTMYQYSSKKTSVVPLFKVYGNRGDSIFISKNRRRHDSLYSFLDNKDLPHSLVCAAREGSVKTYEIDRVIKKYPLVFFTVNSKCDDQRRSERARVWSTILNNTIILDLPFLLVRGFFEIAHIEVKYFLLNNYNQYDNKVTDSMKYKFWEFLDKYNDYIPQFGTLVNHAIVMGVAYYLKGGFPFLELLMRSLILNGNVCSVDEISSLLSSIASPDSHHLGNNIPGFSLGEERSFGKLKAQLKKSDVSSETVSDCSDIIMKLCLIGEKLIDAFEPLVVTVRWRLVQVALKVAIRAVPFIVRKCRNKSKQPTNYAERGVGKEVVTPDDGNYSLDHFIKETTRTENILESLSDVQQVKSIVEYECGEIAADPEFICVDPDKNVHISLAPTSAVMEKLLQDSRGNARVFASEDGSFYDVSSEDALCKVYPYQNSKSNMEIQYIYVEKKLSSSGQNIFK